MTGSSSDISPEVRLLERERPDGSPVMYQQWQELLFLHWAVEPEVVQRDLPEGLTVDTFNRSAWIGIVPFQMRKVRPRFLPAVPWFSYFPELNLRTYVVDSKGRPGVWFYSLDTPQPIANWIARRFFNLNYRLARFSVEMDDIGSHAGSQASLSSARTIKYNSQLRRGDSWDDEQAYHWTRKGQAYHAAPESLEFYLVERYRLFAYDSRNKRIRSGQVHHRPYPLQEVDLANYSKRLFGLNQLSAPEGAPASVLASSGVDVDIFGLETVSS